MIHLHTQQIVEQHTRICENVIADVMKHHGLWDGDDGSKAKAARKHAYRFTLESMQRQPMVQCVIFDGAHVCTVVTSVDFREGGIAAITSVQA